MYTLMMRSNASVGSSGKSIKIEVLGNDSPARDALKASIDALEHHPARAERRSLMDMLSLIEKHNFQIRFTEHTTNDEGLEEWLFILQG